MATKPIQKINVPLLRKVQKAILSEPTKFDMLWWFEHNKESPCGTTACIGGHAIAIEEHFKKLSQGHKLNRDPMTYAGKILGLTRRQQVLLFGAYDWPDKFRFDYHQAKTPEDAAKAASARIDHFIKTNGEE